MKPQLLNVFLLILFIVDRNSTYQTPKNKQIKFHSKNSQILTLLQDTFEYPHAKHDSIANNNQRSQVTPVIILESRRYSLKDFLFIFVSDVLFKCGRNDRKSRHHKEITN